MKLGSLASARPAWYDRSPTEISYQFQGATGGFTNGTQFTYTVPAGKLFYLDSAYAGQWINTAVAANGICQSTVVITPSGGTSVQPVDVRTYVQTTAGTTQVQNLGGSILVKPSGTVAGYAVILSTGGDVKMANCIHGIEFVA